jgi:hypothetical protein
MKRLLVVVTIFIGNLAQALLVCNDSPCSAACDSTCTWNTCTGNSSVSFTISAIPYSSYVTPADACADTMDGVTISAIPYTIDGVNHTKIQENITHPYLTCETNTDTGPACPPPP